MSPALVAQATLPPNLMSLVPLVIILGVRRRQARLVGMRNRDIHAITQCMHGLKAGGTLYIFLLEKELF